MERQISKSRSILVTRRSDYPAQSSQIKLFFFFGRFKSGWESEHYCVRIVNSSVIRKKCKFWKFLFPTHLVIMGDMFKNEPSMRTIFFNLVDEKIR